MYVQMKMVIFCTCKILIIVDMMNPCTHWKMKDFKTSQLFFPCCRYQGEKKSHIKVTDKLDHIKCMYKQKIAEPT